ncbi:hypothetical protein [Saccharothrix xinjiangensis]|uniref:Uncharacterized protein n=1 Tax=Saccharothrix xinjiangensis TaxID=204798 RepID=A0ABV9XTW5_9PSEU
MNRPLPPPHEDEILRAIADGIPHHELVRMGEWTEDDVAVTLARHDLVVTPGGSIVRASFSVPDLVLLADSSASPHVRRAATRANQALIALAALLGREHAGERVDAVRREQKAAVVEWLALLQDLRLRGEAELRRLKQPIPRTRRAPHQAG